MQYVYVRVSTEEQNVDRQINMIKERFPNILGDNIYIEKETGRNNARPEYLKLRERLVEGDELIVHELDRLGRNKSFIKKEVEFFRQSKVKLRVLELPTTLQKLSPESELVADMLDNIMIEVYSTLAQQEIEKLSKRTKEGLIAAKKRGQQLGRPRIPAERTEKAVALYHANVPIAEILKECRICKKTLYNYLK
jgi:DNA invertase Pin-like site-specific DNA recombinase